MKPSKSFLRVIIMITIFLLPALAGPFAIIYYLIPPSIVNNILHGYLDTIMDVNLRTSINIIIDLVIAYALSSLIVYLYYKMKQPRPL